LNGSDNGSVSCTVMWRLVNAHACHFICYTVCILFKQFTDPGCRYHYSADERKNQIIMSDFTLEAFVEHWFVYCQYSSAHITRYWWYLSYLYVVIRPWQVSSAVCSSVHCYCRGWSALAMLTYAYVTSSDVRNISDFDEQTVIAIKAPSQTKLEISDPDEVALIVCCMKSVS